MASELTKRLMCIQMRSGVEIWVESEKVEEFQTDLENTKQHFFARFDGQTVNTADVVGVFTADTMESHTRRKNGQTPCKHGAWHDKGEKCACIAREDRERIKRRDEAINACGKCYQGFITNPDGSMGKCTCLQGL